MEKQNKILIIDDDILIGSALRRLLHVLDADITVTQDPAYGLELATQNHFDIIISDQRMTTLSGTELFRQLRAIKSNFSSILISGYADFDVLIEAFNQGLVDQFVTKPWDNKALVKQVHTLLKLHQPISEKSKKDHGLQNFHGLLSSSDKMQEAFANAGKAARSNMPVFICGETGTGKELMAKAVHVESHRADRPFISFNCANFTESLMESQLFGHKKGSFTGAFSDQEGLLAQVQGGTLFLDEVTSMSISLQSKLLRVLQEREYSALGTHHLQPFKGQIISASSCSLRQACENDSFRQDLRYRLEVISIVLPPLRDRDDDSVLLLRHFLRSIRPEENRPLDTELITKLRNYPWTGNIRELENTANYLLAMTDDKTNCFTSQHLPPEINHYDPNTVSNNTLGSSSLNQANSSLAVRICRPKDIRSEELSHALNLHHRNRTRTAEALGISRMTLWRLMKRFELST